MPPILTSNTRVQKSIGLTIRRLSIQLLRTKDHAVHAGPSLQSEHLKSTQTLNSTENTNYLNKIWLTAQDHMTMMDAMVDGWILLLNMLLTTVWLKLKIIHTLLKMEPARPQLKDHTLTSKDSRILTHAMN